MVTNICFLVLLSSRADRWSVFEELPVRAVLAGGPAVAEVADRAERVAAVREAVASEGSGWF